MNILAGLASGFAIALILFLPYKGELKACQLEKTALQNKLIGVLMTK